MSLTPTYKKFKTDPKDDGNDGSLNAKNSVNGKIYNLSDLKQNEDNTYLEETATRTQISPKLVEADDSQHSEDLANVEKSLENMFKRRKPQLERLATTPPIQQCEEFLDENTCSIALAERANLQITSIDGFFNRKRGRPPKNRFVEVYKNTHQKPQAIFTSFKLEKHGKNAGDGNNISHNDLETLSCANDGNNTYEYSRLKPHHINSTLRKRSYDKVNNLSSHSKVARAQSEYTTINVANIPTNNCKTSYNDLVNDNDNNDGIRNSACSSPQRKENGFNTCKEVDLGCITPFSLAAYEETTIPTSTNQKLYGTAENVTVVRAAGTFYPENSHEISKFTEIFLKKLNDKPREKRSLSPNFENDEEKLKLENSSVLNSNDVAQDLSLKDTSPNGTSAMEGAFSTTAISSSVLPSPSTLSSSSVPVLPQILNVLQMQQQLLAFYQQMALIMPTLRHLDFKTLLAPAPPAAAPTANETTPQSSFMQFNDHDLQQRRILVNLFLNLQQVNQEQKLNVNKESTISESETQKEPISIPHIRTSSFCVSQSETTAVSEPILLPEAKEHQSSSRLLQGGVNFCNGRERLPSGYLRFRFNEDCGYDKCGYRQHQSHFHCNRTDCQYSFCDKTRFVQHTARHERLDTLMGSDFQQFRATMSCNNVNCPYNNNNAQDDFNDSGPANSRKSSHFHCLKCQFVCADTNKVVAHRRLHSKMEFIRSAGFRKVASNDNCMISAVEVNTNLIGDNECYSLTNSDRRIMPQLSGAAKSPPSLSIPATDTATTMQHCPYYMRHAHYHCLTCNCSVLSRSQLVAHKHRTTATLSSLTEAFPLPTETTPPATTTSKITTPSSTSSNSNIS